MRKDRVLITVLHLTHDARCFSSCVYSYFHQQLSENFILAQKMPTFGLYEYKVEGSGCGLIQSKTGPR